MTITRSNYESWFLDFLEGNLVPSLTTEFQEFLIQNADLAKELEMWDSIPLIANKSIQFEVKEGLKKMVNNQETEFQELAVAYYEGDLSLSDRKIFEAGLSENSDRTSDAEKFGMLKLVADKAILYPKKDQLKKRGTLLPIWVKISSVAAILLLAYMLIHPGVEVQPGSRQLVDDLKNQDRKNAVAPEVRIKAEAKNNGKTTLPLNPVQIPVIVPASKNRHPSGEKQVRKAIPTPDFRSPEPEPSPLKPRGINIGLPANSELASVTFKDPAQVSRELELSELLKVQLAAMRNSDDREFLSTEHLGLSGLQLFAKLSGKRLTAMKGDDGTVHSVSYNSRLLAFSIPVNR